MIEFNEQDCPIPARVGEKAQVTVSIKRLNGASGWGTGYTELVSAQLLGSILNLFKCITCSFIKD